MYKVVEGTIIEQTVAKSNQTNNLVQTLIVNIPELDTEDKISLTILEEKGNFFMEGESVGLLVWNPPLLNRPWQILSVRKL